MYGLYSAYGGKLSKLYWSWFKKYSIVRALTAVNEDNLPFHYHQIKEADGTDCLMSFNMGSPGVEQKYPYWDMTIKIILHSLLSFHKIR